jgi:hypothetical protein
MIIVREHVHTSPHVVHNHREPLKQGIDGLNREMSEVLILSPVGLKDRYGEPERGSEWEPIKNILE